MKRSLVVLFVALTLKLSAQTYPITIVNITLPTNPDAKTALWNGGAGLLSITATGAAMNGRPTTEVEGSKLLVVIKKNGAKVYGTFTSATAPSANFNTLNKVWAGNTATTYLGQAYTLPAGSYELSVQLFGAKNGGIVPLSAEKTKPFTIKADVDFQAPVAVLPTHQTLLAQNALSLPLTFKWLPVTPTRPGTTIYRLKVWQLLQGQTASQAMQVNTPLVSKDVNNISQTVVTGMLPAPCTPPYTCSFVWTVQALAQENGMPVGGNNGTTAPQLFSVENPSPGQPNTGAGCAVTSVKTYVEGDIVALSNGFVMRFSANPTGTNSALSGKGTVFVKWLGILAVQFKNIKINANDALCSGAVYTITDPDIEYNTQWGVNALGHSPWGARQISKIKEICDWVQSKKLLKPLVKTTDVLDSTVNTAPVKMPIGYYKTGDALTAVAVVEAMFTPDHAELEGVISIPTKGLFKDGTGAGADELGFQGKALHFTQNGISSGAIKLAETISFPYAAAGGANLRITYFQEASGHMGNGLVFGGPDFWKYNLDADVEFPPNWLIPVDPSKTKAAVNFQAEIARYNDFVLEGSLPACIIPKSNGLGIQVSSITYDHSSIANAPLMVFPTGYAGNTNTFFTGFYLKEFKLTLPDQLRSYADTTKKVELVAQNMLIDEEGISAKILANNVISYPKANVGNLGASIDTVSVQLANSILTQAKMRGKVTLPMSASDTEANAIAYSVLFVPGTSAQGDPTASSLTFTLQPGQDVTTKFFGDGKLQLDQTSSLSMVLSKSAAGKRTIRLEIDLNGRLYYPTGKILDPGGSAPLDLDLSCDFEHLKLKYDRSASETLTFDPGHWAFASPQKALAGFKFTIVDVKPKILPIGTGSEKQYLFKGGVEFVAKINLGAKNSKVKISGDTKIVLTGAVESSRYTPPSGTVTSAASAANLTVLTSQLQTTGLSSVVQGSAKSDYGFLTQLTPKYLGVRVDSVRIYAKTPPVEIKGSVAFYRQDPVYGNGFKGELQAKFTTPKVTVQAAAIFGNTKYIPGNSGEGFKYWKVEAQANLPNGIPFITGLVFRGFGGGVYSRMTMTPPAVFNATAANSSTFGGAVFTPDASVSFGFKAKAIIATQKEETFNGSVALGAQFNTNGGMEMIRIDGLFNCGAKIGEETKAFANGTLDLQYDFPLKKFSTNLDITFNKAPVTTPYGPVNAHFYIDGLKNEWAFTSGSPVSLNTIRLFDLVNVSSYLMFGNKITPPTGFMQPTVNGFANIQKTLPTFAESAVTPESRSAKGLAFGIGLYANSYREKTVVSGDKFSAGIKYSFNIGGEINASLMQYQNCPGFGDGWRVKAGAAVFARMDGRAFYAYNGSSVSFSKEVNLLSLGFGAYAYTEFPNPFYAEGSVSGYARVLDFINFNFSADFKTGDRCEGTSVVTQDAVYAQENATESLDKTLINSIITPGSATGVSRTTSFTALLNYPDGEAFSVEEQQASGLMKVRTFRAIYAPKLTQDSIPAPGGAAQLSTTLSAKAFLGSTTAGSGQPTSAKPAVQQANLAKSVVSNPAANALTLVATGYDDLGARIYHLPKNGPQTIPLKANTSYKLLITATLQEKINNAWVTVRHPVSQAPIVRTKGMYFKTDNEQVNTAVTQSSSQIVKTAIH